MSWIHKGKVAYHCEDCIYAPVEFECPDNAFCDEVPDAGVQTVCPAFVAHPAAIELAKHKLMEVIE